jgi:hypothetical protein
MMLSSGCLNIDFCQKFEAFSKKDHGIKQQKSVLTLCSFALDCQFMHVV